jgi:hypothetical protein
MVKTKGNRKRKVWVVEYWEPINMFIAKEFYKKKVNAKRFAKYFLTEKNNPKIYQKEEGY